MRKSICMVISIMLVMSCFSVYAADDEKSNMNISVTKYTDTIVSGGIVYTMKPYTIEATFDNGDGATEELFTKKAWYRVDTLEENVDLPSVYNSFKGNENIILDSPVWYAKTLRTILRLDVTLNGTYLFLGWSGNNEQPDFIERIDITDIEVERPMAWLEGYKTTDYSQDIIANIKVKNITCGKDARIKRYAFVKDYYLPPGSWPESLPPEYCNEFFDEKIGDLYDKFVNGGLYLGDNQYTDGGTEIIPTDNTYPIRDVGSYILFIEDTNGRYTHINGIVGSETNTGKAPEIIANTIKSDGGSDTINVTAASDNGIAKLDYSILGEHDVWPSDNGTDEYFLEKERHKIENDTITISGTAVVCAVDNVGNASYKRIELSGDPVQPTTSPDYYYLIKNMSILTQSGGQLSVPPKDASFMVEVEVNKVREINEKDYVFVAVYDKNGMLLNIDYVRANFAPNYDCSFGFNIPPQNSEIGSIKAFVWDNFNSATPLAETQILNFQ